MSARFRWPWTRKGNSLSPSPGTGTSKGWKPFTLRLPYLLSVSVISLALVAVLEFLSRKSNATGGVVFADKTGQFTTLQTFSLLYLPTIISVTYSLAWSWIELDVKRLEPYYQLSGVNGALAESSILLEYPLEFIPLVPLRAAKLGQWSVFCAASSILVVFWIITPLQSAIFASRQATQTLSVSAQSFLPLPTSGEAKRLTSSFLSTAFGVVWLNQNLPGFITQDYAVEPFKVDDIYKDASTTWTTQALSYFTDLNCTPVLASQNPLENSTYYTFLGDSGCTAGVDKFFLGFTDNNKYFLRYFGLGNFSLDVDTPYVLPISNCTSETVPNALTLWGEVHNSTHGPILFNITASFCTANYFSQMVNVTVDSLNSSIKSMNAIGSRTPMTNTDFNATDFESVLDFGGSLNLSLSDFPDQELIDTSHQIGVDEASFSANDPVKAFALGLSDYTIEEYYDFSSMQESFARARRLLFSLAVNQLQDTPRSPPVETKVIVNTDVQAITVVRVFAIIVEVHLCVLSLCALALLIIYSKRASSFLKDPASIEDIMKLMPTDLRVLSKFLTLDTASFKDLKKEVTGDRYRLKVLKGGQNAPETLIVKVSDAHSALKQSRPTEKAPIVPLQISWKFGVSIMVLLILSIVLLNMLHQRVLILNGLPIPTNNLAVQQIILNYVPIVFATFLEPLLVLLNRTLCVLQPFNDLFRQDVQPSTSICLKYTSLPPQLVIWRAIKARHFLLAATSTVTILVNVLAVSLSNLFEVQMTSFAEQKPYHPQSLPVFTGNYSTFGLAYGEDHLYIARANLTEHALLPPWTTPDFYFLPFDLDAETPSSTSGFATVGFGIDSTCRAIDQSTQNPRTSFQLSEDGKTLNFLASYDTDHGDSIICTTLYDMYVYTTQISQTANSTETILSLSLDPGRASIQFATTMQSLNDSSTESVKFCLSRMLFYWGHATFPAELVLNNKGHITDPDLLFVTCEPSLKTANFSVRAKGNGQILSYTRISSYDTILDHYFALNSTSSDLFSKISYYLATAGSQISILSPNLPEQHPTWQNSKLPQVWINYLVHAITNSSALSDPSGSLTDLSFLPALEGVNRLLFSILLGLYPESFVPAPPQTIVPGTMFTTQPRVFMNSVSLILSVSILALIFVVVLIYYLNRPPRFLPRMPTSIGSLFGYIAASHARKELRRGKRSDRYRFGKFIGVDGKMHVGVEEAEKVFPLPASYDEKERRRWLRRKNKAPLVPPKN